MLVVYVAGPYRSPTPWGILWNIRQAQQTALHVWKAGAVAICPHANTALFDGEAPDKVWLQGDLELLRRSDAVITVLGWSGSAGARAEVNFAQEIGKPVFHAFGELMDWLVQRKEDLKL